MEKPAVSFFSPSLIPNMRHPQQPCRLSECGSCIGVLLYRVSRISCDSPTGCATSKTVQLLYHIKTDLTGSCLTIWLPSSTTEYPLAQYARQPTVHTYHGASLILFADPQCVSPRILSHSLCLNRSHRDLFQPGPPSLPRSFFGQILSALAPG